MGAEKTADKHMRKSEKMLERGWCLSFDLPEKPDLARWRETNVFQAREQHKQRELHELREAGTQE